MRSISRTRNAFTLIELLTVIAIITLLIGIVLPAMGRARDSAKTMATKAMYHSIGTGSEMFRNDNNKFPESYAASFYSSGGYVQALKNWSLGSAATGILNGANLIVDAMVGRDLGGYDPKMGPDPSYPSSGPLITRWNTQATATGQTRERKGQYVTAESMNISNRIDKKPHDKWGDYATNGANSAMPIADMNLPGLAAPVFLDKFDFPILYYRANPSVTAQTKIIQSGSWASDTPGDGVYDGRDNQTFTADSSQMNRHLIWDGPRGIMGSEPPAIQDNAFVRYIRSNKSSLTDASGNITFSKPVNPDTFLLISPGKDGIYGNGDDIKNFGE